ncbi:RICIN domain-containing protein [Streptomyces sp. NPDC014892]|uniref:RICIN domain-containing protein n=1 Tax=Streptomyces sp. NPDC014892 TaxID=3364930 RepID=UPI0036F536D5
MSLTAGTSTTLTIGSTSNGASIIQWAPPVPCQERQGVGVGAPTQWWKLVPASNGYYRLANAQSGPCADGQSGSAAGAPRSPRKHQPITDPHH